MSLAGGLIIGLVLANHDLSLQDWGFLTAGLCLLAFGSFEYGKRNR